MGYVTLGDILSDAVLIAGVVVTAQQGVDGHVQVHALPVPEAVDRIRRNRKPVPSIGLLQGFAASPLIAAGTGQAGSTRLAGGRRAPEGPGLPPLPRPRAPPSDGLGIMPRAA